MGVIQKYCVKRTETAYTQMLENKNKVVLQAESLTRP